MFFFIFVIGLFVGLINAIRSYSQRRIRTWKANGYVVKGEFLRCTSDYRGNTIVHIRAVDGQYLTVPFNSLSKSNQKYVRNYPFERMW